MKQKIFTACLVSAACFNDHAAIAANINANATATIVAPVSIEKDTGNIHGKTSGNMSFGFISPGFAQGTAQLFSGGTAEGSNGVNITGSYGSSWLIVSGEPGTIVNISFSSGNSCTLTHESDPEKHLYLINLETESSTVTIDASGNAAFSIGGTLMVPSNALHGLYTGSYDVSFELQ